MPATRYGARVPSSESPASSEVRHGSIGDAAGRRIDGREVLAASARRCWSAHWRDPGFTCPNATTYRWLWLWDSCFHSVVWAELGEAERAVSELEVALSGQDADGFVPHLGYLDGSSVHDGFWGRHGWSSITQPPVYGWTVAELDRRGIDGSGRGRRAGDGPGCDSCSTSSSQPVGPGRDRAPVGVGL